MIGAASGRAPVSCRFRCIVPHRSSPPRINCTCSTSPGRRHRQCGLVLASQKQHTAHHEPFSQPSLPSTCRRGHARMETDAPPQGAWRRGGRTASHGPHAGGCSLLRDAERLHQLPAGGSMTAHLKPTHATATHRTDHGSSHRHSSHSGAPGHVDLRPDQGARRGRSGPRRSGGRGRSADLRRARAAGGRPCGAASRGRGRAGSSCVGVFLDRSPEFVVAALGVLWAGGAYLPIDTASPRDRVEFVLTDADVAVVVTAAWAAGEPPRGRMGPAVDQRARRGRRSPPVRPPTSSPTTWPT